MDRRMTERKAFALPVEYDLGAAAGKDVGIHRAETQDICVGGLRIVTEHPLRNGAVLRLSLPVSGPQTRLPVFAEVVWTLPAADYFRVGLRFLR